MFYRLLQIPQLRGWLEFIYSYRMYYILDLVTVVVYWNLLWSVGLSFPDMTRVSVLVLNALSGQSLLCRLFSTRLLQVLGIWCLGIYLFQSEFYSLDQYFYGIMHEGIVLRIFEVWLVRLCIIIPLAGLSFHFFEKPVSYLGLNYFFKNKSPLAHKKGLF